MTGTVTRYLTKTIATAMARRTYESDGLNVETADDVDELVADKRQGWRANAAKARRRQRRYKKHHSTRSLPIRYHRGEQASHSAPLISAPVPPAPLAATTASRPLMRFNSSNAVPARIAPVAPMG